jgi:hypothetical protein
MCTLLGSARWITSKSLRFNLNLPTKFLLPTDLPGPIECYPSVRCGRQYGTIVASNSKPDINPFLLSGTAPPDFNLFPDIFTISEQKLLLSTCLQQLDVQESRLYRRRREKLSTSHPGGNYDISNANSPVAALFLPDEYYDFQDVLPSFLIHQLSRSRVLTPGYVGTLRRRHTQLPRDASICLATRNSDN